MAEQPRLDVLGAQRLAQQRVVAQVDLRDGEVVRRVPVREQVVELRVVDRRMRLARQPSAPGAVGRGRAERLWDVGGCRSLARHGRPPFRCRGWPSSTRRCGRGRTDLGHIDAIPRVKRRGCQRHRPMASLASRACRSGKP